MTENQATPTEFKKFRTELPNMATDTLDPFTGWLYTHYKKVCGEDATCWESVETTASNCKMSRDKVIQSRQWLHDNGWITLEQKAKGVYHVRIVNRWAENYQRYTSRNIDSSKPPLIHSPVEISNDEQRPVEISTDQTLAPVEISTGQQSTVDISTGLSEEIGAPVDISTATSRYIDTKKEPINKINIQDHDQLGSDHARTPAQDDPTAPTVSETTPTAPAPVIEEPPVPESPVRITRAQIRDAQAALAKAQLPEEIYDPPSKVTLRLQAAQAQLPDVPPPANPKPKVDKTYVKQKLSDEGYITAGTGSTAVEVYYERFSAYNAESRLTAPQQDDLVTACTDLAKLRTVVEAYSRKPYKARNVQLILDWYAKGIQENGSNQSNSAQDKPYNQRAHNERRALGSAPSIGRQQAKELFKDHYLYKGANVA